MIHPHGLSKRELSLTIIGSALLLMLVAFGFVKAKEQSVYTSVLLATNEEQTNKVQFYQAHKERYKQLKSAANPKDASQQETLHNYDACIQKLHDVIDLKEFWTANEQCTAYSHFEDKDAAKVTVPEVKAVAKK